VFSLNTEMCQQFTVSAPSQQRVMLQALLSSDQAVLWPPPDTHD